VHLQVPAAVGAPIYVHRVVKIARRLAVNRNNRQVNENPPPLAVGIVHRMRAFCRLLQLLGEIRAEDGVSESRSPCLHEIARPPENFKSLERREPATRIAHESDVHHCPVQLRQTRDPAPAMRRVFLGTNSQFFLERGSQFLTGGISI